MGERTAMLVRGTAKQNVEDSRFDGTRVRGGDLVMGGRLRSRTFKVHVSAEHGLGGVIW